MSLEVDHSRAGCHPVPRHPKLAGMPLYSIETYGELQPHIREEWLVANGLGGYAAGTVVGCNTRRYHGLLVAANNPPVGRIMLLNRLGELIRVAGQPDRVLEFSVNQFGQIFHPRGDKYLRRFDLETDLVRWEYEIEGIQVIKQLQMSCRIMPWASATASMRGTSRWSCRCCRRAAPGFSRAAARAGESGANPIPAKLLREGWK